MIATAKRQDIHRPSAINPQDYEFVAFGHTDIKCFDDCGIVLENRRRIEEHMKSTGGFYSQHEHGGSCHICGASCIYTVIFYHADSNTYIVTGNDCAEKLEMSYGGFNQFKTALKNYTELQTGKRKAIGLLTDAGNASAWPIYTATPMKHAADCALCFDQEYCPVKCTCAAKNDPLDQYEERTIRDIVGKLVHYGSISEKSMAYVGILLAKIPARAVIAAQRAAEADQAAPVPVGRMVVTGRVLAIKTVDRPTFYYGDSGLTTKILVQDLSGFKVWGPRMICADKGDMVTFTATLEASKDDAKFGFFSRAKKAQFVNETTGEIVPEYPQYTDAKTMPTYEDLAVAQKAWRDRYEKFMR